MKFVFDHYALQYMLEQFPRNITKEYWAQFLAACQNGTITAHKETQKLLEQEVIETDSLKWCKENTSFFKTTTETEASLLGTWMGQGMFDFLETPLFVRSHMPEDIPFMLCMAKKQDRCYVYRKHTNMHSFSKVEEICKKYGITCMEVEECLLHLANH
ncbi:DUF4411 family protein [Flintibacter muris]|uniref:DUF4411 family protein n=1 Tax=Flintibacter muris TaxID=2941327 RepID=UPI0020401F85|nr:DUF4411 family protein [Flintibacter muris]